MGVGSINILSTVKAGDSQIVRQQSVGQSVSHSVQNTSVDGVMWYWGVTLNTISPGDVVGEIV